MSPARTHKRLYILVFAALVIYLTNSSLIAVKETEIAVIHQFGRPVRIIDQAGLAVKLPNPVQTRQSCVWKPLHIHK